MSEKNEANKKALLKAYSEIKQFEKDEFYFAYEGVKDDFSIPNRRVWGVELLEAEKRGEKIKEVEKQLLQEGLITPDKNSA